MSPGMKRCAPGTRYWEHLVGFSELREEISRSGAGSSAGSLPGPELKVCSRCLSCKNWWKCLVRSLSFGQAMEAGFVLFLLL